MTYEETLKVLEEILEEKRLAAWRLSDHDNCDAIAQAIGVFKRMKVDLDIAQAECIRSQLSLVSKAQ